MQCKMEVVAVSVPRAWKDKKGVEHDQFDVTLIDKGPAPRCTDMLYMPIDKTLIPKGLKEDDIVLVSITGIGGGFSTKNTRIQGTITKV